MIRTPRPTLSAARRHFALLPLLTLALLAAVPSSSPAAFVVDQSNEVTSASSYIGIVRASGPGGDGFDVGQTFTAGLSGTLGLVSVRVGRTADTTAALTIEIRSASPATGLPSPTSALASVTLAASSVGVSFPIVGSISGPTGFDFASADFASFALAVNPGDRLAIVVRSSATVGGYFLPTSMGPPDTYARGTVVSRFATAVGAANFVAGATQDLAFVTRVDTAAVPEPASLVGVAVGMMGVGGAGMAMQRKRRVA